MQDEPLIVRVDTVHIEPKTVAQIYRADIDRLRRNEQALLTQNGRLVHENQILTRDNNLLVEENATLMQRKTLNSAILDMKSTMQSGISMDDPQTKLDCIIMSASLLMFAGGELKHMHDNLKSAIISLAGKTIESDEAWCCSISYGPLDPDELIVLNNNVFNANSLYQTWVNKSNYRDPMTNAIIASRDDIPDTSKMIDILKAATPSKIRGLARMMWRETILGVCMKVETAFRAMNTPLNVPSSSAAEEVLDDGMNNGDEIALGMTIYPDLFGNSYDPKAMESDPLENLPHNWMQLGPKQ